VFVVSRMREAYDRGGSTETAVVEGTGRLVTSAALILGLAFVALSASPGTEIKIFATALAAGILLDAHHRPRHARPRRRFDPRPLELVATPLARTPAQGQTLPRPTRNRPRGDQVRGPRESREAEAKGASQVRPARS
jgi:hypothetical protein